MEETVKIVVEFDSEIPPVYVELNNEIDEVVVEFENELDPIEILFELDESPIEIDFTEDQEEIIVEFSEVSLPGKDGKDGHDGKDGLDGNTFSVFEYLMPLATTTAEFDHPFGYDPIYVQVIGLDDVIYDEFSIGYPIPNQRLRVSFDWPLQARIRII